ncbi:hypothetical protein OV079_44625 [Nannocystis pusilla]|uniref:Uncharacterized protein n=1 Tax=Nannocystis pusilla TaxID=889268 RepID=A0A9X3EYB7_9BACT|nr:hypothetical protein [Nannocystis pusilla]MCY1012502.1 hypothetical protein [Nannocystis pusilla]
MRTLALGAAILCGAACIPFAPYWWIEDARLFGTRMTVVEPGGYSTLLQVPPGQQRASALPLDTVEVEWLFAAAEDTEVQPPIWLACTRPGCIEAFYNRGHGLLDCPLPLPFDIPWACRLGEGHRIRFGFAGAFTLALDSAFAGLSLLAIGSRTPEVPSSTCVERYQKSPHVGLEQCLIGRDVHFPGPLWAVLPFAPELGELPLEVVTQAPDTHPDIVGFRVSRARRRPDRAARRARGHRDRGARRAHHRPAAAHRRRRAGLRRRLRSRRPRPRADRAAAWVRAGLPRGVRVRGRRSVRLAQPLRPRRRHRMGRVRPPRAADGLRRGA